MQIYAAIDNDGLVEGVDLEGGGTGSTGAFTGVKFAGGTTFELADGAALNAVTSPARRSTRPAPSPRPGR